MATIVLYTVLYFLLAWIVFSPYEKAAFNKEQNVFQPLIRPPRLVFGSSFRLGGEQTIQIHQELPVCSNILFLHEYTIHFHSHIKVTCVS